MAGSGRQRKVMARNYKEMQGLEGKVRQCKRGVGNTMGLLKGKVHTQPGQGKRGREVKVGDR